MNYYGRGSARIIMPRAIDRPARREWIISPSLLILLISLILFTFYKVAIENNLQTKKNRTIILLPQTPVLPKPTIKEKLSFIKVVKDAAKKSAETRKKELKKVLLPKKNTSKPVVPPPKSKVIPKHDPKPLQILKPKKPKPLQTLAPRKLKIMKAPAQPNARRPKAGKAIALAPKSKVTPQLKTATLPKTRSKQHALSKTQLKVLSPATAEVVTPTNTPWALQKPSAPLPPQKALPAMQKAAISLAPKNTPQPLAHESKGVRRKSFTPLTTGDAPAKMQRRKTSGTAPTLAIAQKVNRPAPKLTQYTTPAAISQTPESDTPKPITGYTPPSSGRATPNLKISQTALSDRLSASQGEVDEGAALHNLVTIEGSTLKNSLRVKSLKEEIYRKTRFMPPEKSPFTFKVRGYRCTVVITTGPTPTTTLSFQPRDATFEVVSALERLLPRRRM